MLAYCDISTYLDSVEHNITVWTGLCTYTDGLYTHKTAVFYRYIGFSVVVPFSFGSMLRSSDSFWQPKNDSKKSALYSLRFLFLWSLSIIHLSELFRTLNKGGAEPSVTVLLEVSMCKTTNAKTPGVGCFWTHSDWSSKLPLNSLVQPRSLFIYLVSNMFWISDAEC